MAKPAQIGLYFGDYSHISGLCLHWVHTLRVLGYGWLPLWDTSFRRKGALDDVDVLIVPGGFCWNTSDAFGGESGRRRIRQRVERGMMYIGTCYGANVAMAKGQRRGVFHLELVQGRALDANEDAFMGVTRVDYHLPGSIYTATSQATTHINGPRFGDGDYEVIGRFSTEQPGPFDQRPKNDIAGQPAVVAAELGRGKVFLFAGHPEIPIAGVYDQCISDLIEGTIAPATAVRRLWHPPVLLAENVRLLQMLLTDCPRGSGRAGYCLDDAWLAERVALVASAKELLKLRYDEVKSQIDGIAKHASSSALKCACEVAARRFRQVQRCISRISPQADSRNPADFARNSLMVLLQRIYCNCDHSGLMREARLDYMIAKARRLAKLPKRSRQADEAKLARRILNIIVRGADDFLNACESK